MSGTRRRIACLVALLALAAPQAAFAQGAGDEQYQDPFAGDQEEATPTPAPTAAPAPSGESTQATAQATPTPAPASEPVAQVQLPRTGNDPLVPAVAGFWLLIGGVALRAKVRVR